ncbi:MAG: hypothetical protein MJY95_04940 [Bacteroidaceae bacterium]|nr:hypothetical protein [Bacteroidaceae bacterium]
MAIRTYTIIISIIFSLNAFAQGQIQKDRMQQIRTQYQIAQRWVEESQMTDETNNSTSIYMRRVTEKDGMQVKKIDFFYNPNKEGNGWHPYFVRVGYNAGLLQCKEEYLFDEENGNIMYVRSSEEKADGNTLDLRHYFNENGSFCYCLAEQTGKNGKRSTPKELSNLDESHPKVAEAIKKATEIKRIFDSLVNGD